MENIQYVKYDEKYNKDIVEFLRHIVMDEFSYDWGDYFNNYDFTPYTKPGSAFFLAMQSGKIIATSAMKKIDDKHVRFNSFYVDMAYRKMGIGKNMYNSAMEYCKGHGYSLVTLHTHPKFTAAIKFYNKNYFFLFEEDEDGFWYSKRVNILPTIIGTTKYVAKNSLHVTISKDKVLEFAKQIENKKMPACWFENMSFGLLSYNLKDIVNFLVMYHSIGYSYWGEPKWSVEHDNNMYDGASAMIYCILNLMKDNDFDMSKLANLTFEEFASYLKGNIQIPLIETRYIHFKDTAQVICNKMNGDFYEYIKDIVNDIELLDIVANSFNSYEDISNYNNTDVYIYKRAQLLVSDILHILKYKENIQVNYTNLVGCADYKIPQIMRHMGILEYDDELSNLVDNKIEVEKGSIFENEIRANTIVAIDMIYENMNNKISRIDINDMIWLQGQEKTNNVLPYHRTRTDAY